MHIGYVRVSTNEQNTALQRDALERSGCELIFEDKMSGKTSDRPGLKKLLKTLSSGDTLVVWKLDRLGRSMRHLVILVEELRQRNVRLGAGAPPIGIPFFWPSAAMPNTVMDEWSDMVFLKFNGATFS
ncbi:recombinase family protein, partial [Enterobacter hormaechei subsp. xiangfangensis]|nr:recombinase family protein [Enterobacter hormaechei subsp. xiangfangensis]